MSSIYKKWRQFIDENTNQTGDLCSGAKRPLFYGLTKVAAEDLQFMPQEDRPPEVGAAALELELSSVFHRALQYTCKIWNNPRRYRKLNKSILGAEEDMRGFLSLIQKQLPELVVHIGDREEILNSLTPYQRKQLERGTVSSTGLSAVTMWESPSPNSELVMANPIIAISFSNMSHVSLHMETIEYTIKEELHHFFSVLEKHSTGSTEDQAQLRYSQKMQHVQEIIDTRLIQDSLESRALLFMKKSYFESTYEFRAGRDPAMKNDKEFRVFQILGRYYKPTLSPDQALTIMKKVSRSISPGGDLYNLMISPGSGFFRYTDKLHNEAKYNIRDSTSDDPSTWGSAEFTHRIQQIRDLGCRVSGSSEEECNKNPNFEINSTLLHKIIEKAYILKLGIAKFLLFVKDYDTERVLNSINTSLASEKQQKMSDIS